MDRGADGHTVPGCCGGVPRSEFGLEYASSYARLPLLRWGGEFLTSAGWRHNGGPPPLQE